MAENKTPENKTEEPKVEEVKAPTAEELKAQFDALPEMFQETINKLNAEIDAHNSNVDSVKAAGAQDPKLIKAEIFEQNPKNNRKLARLREEELKLIKQIEDIRKQAYEVIDTDGLMPKELTEAEVEKLKAEVASNAKTLKDQVTALSTMEEMMPFLKGKVLIHVHEIKTQRGTAKTGTKSGGEGPKRPRFKRIEINGVTADDKGNTVYGLVDGNEKYTFSFASAYLRKQHKGINWTSNDLQTKYFGDKTSQDDLPEIHEFVMPYTYKDAGTGNDVTINYTIKAYR